MTSPTSFAKSGKPVEVIAEPRAAIDAALESSVGDRPHSGDWISLSRRRDTRAWYDSESIVVSRNLLAGRGRAHMTTVDISIGSCIEAARSSSTSTGRSSLVVTQRTSTPSMRASLHHSRRWACRSHDFDFDGKVDRQILREILRAGERARSSILRCLLTHARRRDAVIPGRLAWSDGRRRPAAGRPGAARTARCDRSFALGRTDGRDSRHRRRQAGAPGPRSFFPMVCSVMRSSVRSELLPLALGRAEEHFHDAF